ncbi:MAG: MBL fold metallo-hydrolase [Candidatus Wallbacteria bacterium]|nr:MBL fold metallo-hydrolase [Candidatus Wallbacteria bacterium]
MKFEITYIFHNCFTLSSDDLVFLFDYPTDSYLNPAVREMVLSKIRGKKTYILTSHSHADHFNRFLQTIIPVTADVQLVLSSDAFVSVEDTLRQFEPYCAEPETDFTIGGIEMAAIRSNDEGVAYLIEIGDTHVYFGGDLARWEWEKLTPEESALYLEYFEQVLKKLEKWRVDIAFSDADNRVRNWSGAADVVKKLAPKMFIPMHAFGKTSLVSEFISTLPSSEGVFSYKNPGDSIIVEFSDQVQPPSTD